MSDELPQVRRRQFAAFDARTISRLPTSERGQWWGRLEKLGYVYGVEFDNGDVKVGRSSDPRRRLSKHQDDVRRWLGAEVTQGWISPEHANHIANERTLLHHCGSIGGEMVRGVEVFRNVEFNAVTAKAKRLRFVAALQGPVEDKAGFVAATLAAGLTVAEREARERTTGPNPARGGSALGPVEIQQSLLRISRSLRIPASEVMAWNWNEMHSVFEQLRLNRELNALTERLEAEGRTDLLDPLLPEGYWLPDEPEQRDPSPQVLLPDALAHRVEELDEADRGSVLEIARWMAAWELRRVAGSWRDVSAPTRAALNRRGADLEQTKALRISAQPPYDPDAEEESELTDEVAAAIAEALGWGDAS